MGSYRDATFCFPGPALTGGETRVELLLQRNPWPAFVAYPNLRQPRSQPLLHVHYSPVPMYGVARGLRRWYDLKAMFDLLEQILPGLTADIPQASSQSDPSLGEDEPQVFRDFVTMVHEAYHLWSLDWTPAKELARTYLAFVYASLNELLFSPGRSAEELHETWSRFVWLNEQLGEIQERIALVEELVPTAGAFALILESRPLMMPLGRAIAETVLPSIRATALKRQADQHKGFSEAYRGVETLIGYVVESMEFGSLALPLLQTVEIDEQDGLLHARSSDRCLAEVLSALENSTDIATATARLQPLRQRSEQNWHLVLRQQLDLIREHMRRPDDPATLAGRYAGALWYIARGHAAYASEDTTNAVVSAELARTRDEGLFPLHLMPEDWLELYPTLYRGQQVLSTEWYPDEMQAPEMQDTLRTNAHALLFFEGIRLQLIRREGMVCPYGYLYRRGTLSCCCSPEIRAGMEHLARLAHSGVFGSGIWSLLRCRR